MRRFLKWMRAEVDEDFGKREQHPKCEKKENSPDKYEEETAKNTSAYLDFCNRAKEELENYTPNGAAFKIIQEASGHYQIYRRMVRSAAHFVNARSFLTKPTCWEEWPTKPVEVYNQVLNPEAPIFTKNERPIRDWDESPSGYRPIIFNSFEDAESYLFRMVRKDVPVAEYDFPPLKKRPASVAEKEPNP